MCLKNQIFILKKKSVSIKYIYNIKSNKYVLKNQIFILKKNSVSIIYIYNA